MASREDVHERDVSTSRILSKSMLDSLILSGRNRLTQVTAAVYLGMSLPDSVQEHAGSAPIWFTVGTRQVEMLHSCQHVDDLHLRGSTTNPNNIQSHNDRKLVTIISMCRPRRALTRGPGATLFSQFLSV